MTPLEIQRRLAIPRQAAAETDPHVAGGLTSMQLSGDPRTSRRRPRMLDETFGGYHLLGGAEYKITRWLGVAGEASWTHGARRDRRVRRVGGV